MEVKTETIKRQERIRNIDIEINNWRNLNFNSEKMTNEFVLIELVKYFKSKMKIKTNTVTLDEFIKLANSFPDQGAVFTPLA